MPEVEDHALYFNEDSGREISAGSEVAEERIKEVELEQPPVPNNLKWEVRVSLSGKTPSMAALEEALQVALEGMRDTLDKDTLLGGGFVTERQDAAKKSDEDLVARVWVERIEEDRDLRLGYQDSGPNP